MRLVVVIPLLLVLWGCGSANPTGDLNKCSGTMSVTEVNSDTNIGSVFYLGSYSVLGQYMSFRSNLVARDIWLSVFTNDATSIKVSIFKNRMSDVMPAASAPIAEFTATQGMTPSAQGDLWIQLPDSFEFEATPDDETGEEPLYFIAIQPIGGTIVLNIHPKSTASRSRKGIRHGGSDGSYSINEPGNAFGMGVRGDSSCKVTQN